MNKKQCPKCGEDNPPEAVMCWACYTPLSGGAAAGGPPAGGGRSTPSATGDGEEKKTVPPWQMAVIGIGLLVAIGAGVKSMMPSSPDGGEGTDATLPVTTPKDSGGATSASPPAAPVSPAPGGTVSVTPTEVPFKILVPPSPRDSVATIAIITTDKNASGPMAASYAAYVRRQYASQSSRWSTIYIYVFSDERSAQAFSDAMKRRRGAPLGSDDLSSLSSVWGGALARYEYSKGKERVLYPSKNPSGWWR